MSPKEYLADRAKALSLWCELTQTRPFSCGFCVMCDMMFFETCAGILVGFDRMTDTVDFSMLPFERRALSPEDPFFPSIHFLNKRCRGITRYRSDTVLCACDIVIAGTALRGT